MKSLSKLKKKTFDAFSKLIWRLGRFEESFSNVLWVDANLMQQTHALRQFTAKPTLSMDLSCKVYRRTAHKDACLTRILLLLGCALWSVYQNPTKSPSPFTRKQSLGTLGLNLIQYFMQFPMQHFVQYFTTPGAWYLGSLVCKSHRYCVVIEEEALWVEGALRGHFGNDLIPRSWEGWWHSS